MPWHEKAMKDVVSCDKPRGGANNLRSGDFRMGEPSTGHAVLRPDEYIVWFEPTRGSETSEYPQEKKVITISSVAASERETAQTVLYVKARVRCASGVVGLSLTGIRTCQGVTKQTVSRIAWKG